MRKQTKLVAVLSAAALLAMGASMTSFAAGWEKDDAGVWHYYDSDDEMVTDEWKKDGGKWFHLDDEGDMETNTWVDDDYYVGEDGAMLTNAWKYTMSDDDQDDPDPLCPGIFQDFREIVFILLLHQHIGEFSIPLVADLLPVEKDQLLFPDRVPGAKKLVFQKTALDCRSISFFTLRKLSHRDCPHRWTPTESRPASPSPWPAAR